MTKRICILLALTLILIPLFGCAPAAKPTLTVMNWKAYGSDKDYSVPVFEEMYNCKVEHVYFNSLEEMITMLQTGGFGKIDCILPNTNYLRRCVEEGIIQPIDWPKLENYGYLRDDLRNFRDAYDADGNIYGVPWAWGTTSLGYNPDVITEPIDSWSALWSDEYAGKVAYFDDYNTAILTAALYLNEPDPANPDLAKIEEALMALKKNAKTWWDSYDSYTKPYLAGEIVIGNMWVGLASSIYREGTPLEYVYPKEGAVGWADYWAIAKDAPNYDLALKWIEFMISDQFQSDFVNDPEGACPASEAVLNALSDDMKKAFFIYPEPPGNLVMQAYQDEATRDAWLDLWNRVKAG